MLSKSEPEHREPYDMAERIHQLKNGLIEEKIDFLLMIYQSLQKCFEGTDAERRNFEDVNSRLDAIETRLTSIERTIRQQISMEFKSLMTGLQTGIVKKIEEVKAEDSIEVEQKLEELKSLIISERANVSRQIQTRMESVTEVYSLENDYDDDDDDDTF